MKKLILFLTLLTHNVYSQNCTAPTTGLVPINDLGTGTFTNAASQVWTGGLYLGGSNYMPYPHKAAGIQQSIQIAPRDTSGGVNQNGKIVWLSIGMSNANFESQQFIPIANGYSNKNPKLMLINGAQGSMSAERISSPWLPEYYEFWDTLYSRLSDSGVNFKQVQVIWFKEANPIFGSGATVMQYYDSLQVQFTRAMHEINVRFPNAKICYMASRISARYATTNLNPEPYSYYTGWAVRNLIEKQINGDTSLIFSGPNKKSPFLMWGIYMWSDGSTPQVTNPNIFIDCPVDLTADGTHPSATGSIKVGNWLLDFYKNDTLSCPWFFDTVPNFCKTLSIEELEGHNIIAYPNPFSDQITISGEYQIYDIMGNLIYEGKDFKRNGLPSGTYFVRSRNKVIKIIAY